MSDTPLTVKPVASFAALKNVAGFRELVMQVQERSPSLPNIGVCRGYSGYGKSYASINAQNRTRAIRVEVGDSWTRKKFLTAILREGGIQNPVGSVADLTEEVIGMLAEDPKRPLFIDEADKVFDKGYAELVREIAMSSNVPVILIGEEALPNKIQRIERIHNRVLAWFDAEPCDLEDAKKLAELYLTIPIHDALLDHIRVKGEGRARRICTTLEQAAHFARNHGLTELTAENYRGPIHTGETPKARGARVSVEFKKAVGRVA